MPLSAPASEEAADAGSRPAREYFREFVSPAFRTSYPNIYRALGNVFDKLPSGVYRKITRRELPVIFVPAISSGIARYANATEFTFGDDDPPAFQEGFYLIILSDELNNHSDIRAIEGVIAHEIAHRYLNHLRQDKLNCEMEIEANRLVQEWGFEKEFENAKEVFGAKTKGDSPCQTSGVRTPSSDTSGSIAR